MTNSSWIVYVLRCADGSLYTGITNDLRRRLAAHRAGTASRYTRARGPVRVVHREPAADHGAALRREAAIKRLPRTAKLALIGTRT
jgi:putative endonuclease